MASKKKKSVKKYAVGGDMRVSPLVDKHQAFQNDSAMIAYDPFPGGNDRPGGSGGGGFDDTATGQVRQVSQSARMAADKLRGAGQAQQQAGSMLGNTGRGRGLDGLFGDYKKGGYKKGGKVKKSAKTSVKVRGAGKAIKGVRPAKMVSMKGS